MNTSFLHVADVHLDSPLYKLQRVDPKLAEQLYAASRSSFETVINEAIRHKVNAVVIAGDLFDRDVKDVGSRLWVESQFQRLTRVDIPVVLIRGNHDWQLGKNASQWPDGVHELGSEHAETILLESAGLAIHGQSFGARTENRDLTLEYPGAAAGMFNVGVLHTSLAGTQNHDTYAPTTIETLESKGYDYWALGHIHARSDQSLSQKCYVGYSGNTQGRHIREPGAKGCQLVQIADGQLSNIEFLPSDMLRWQEIELDLSTLSSVVEIEDLVEQNANELLATSEGRSLAVRLRLTGSTSLHGVLTKFGYREQLADIENQLPLTCGPVWLEKIVIDSLPELFEVESDAALMPLKYVDQVTQEFRQSEQSQLELKEVVEQLLRKARSELSAYHWPLADPELQDGELLKVIEQAEMLLAGRLSMTSQGGEQ